MPCPRGIRDEDNLSLLVAELARVVLEVGIDLGKKPSKCLLIASILG